jgi:hypothetical protein
MRPFKLEHLLNLKIHFEYLKLKRPVDINLQFNSKIGKFMHIVYFNQSK